MISTTVMNQLDPIFQLNLNDRIEVYQLLWESILKDMPLENSPLSQEQKHEVDRRLQRIENGEAKLFSWDEVKNDIKSVL